jgi:hypothetical protein
MSTFSCTQCNKSFSSALGLAGHSRMHGNSGGTNKQVMCCCVITREEIRPSLLAQHVAKLEPCSICSKLFRRRKDHNYCSASCAAIFRNFHRHRTPESESKRRTNISITLKKLAKTRNPLLFDPEGPFSKVRFSKCNRTGIYFVSLKDTTKCASPHHSSDKVQICKSIRTCKHCNCKFESKLKKRYCATCSPLYMAEARNRFKFTFNVFRYPELFDLKLLQEVGFYAPKGKSGRWNPDGLSRDHKVSVNESIINQYDPYYITHPLNCELMPHRVNNKKKTKSSMRYEDLVKLVDQYDANTSK